MIKYSFKDDYSEGCHPRILQKLLDTNLLQQEAYGDDSFSAAARNLIKSQLANNSVDIHFVTGGTQANLIVISSTLKPFESVIAANTAHINVHEAGSIEAVGHKINSIETSNGKIKPSQIQEVLSFNNDAPHMVKPKMVYISNSTEVGSIYSRHELKDLSDFCKANHLFLFCDGARIGSALSAQKNDLSLSDMADFTDIFYIGGTKNGALIGEAIVISNDALKADFAYNLKLRGALLSKSRLVGIQFLTLFTDNLFFQLAEQANKMAHNIAKDLAQKGYSFLVEAPTNQLFPILSNVLIHKLQQKYSFHIWKTIDKQHSAIRLVCSWATQPEIVDEFLADFPKVLK